VRAKERLGKEYAQQCAIRVARGDILVFSDVATRIPPEAIGKLAAVFADPRIGAVSSEDRFLSQDGGLVGEGAYVRYEMGLRRMESRGAAADGVAAGRAGRPIGVILRCPSDGVRRLGYPYP